MTDKELLRKIMYLMEWNQSRLARELGFYQSNVSRVIDEIQTLSLDKRQRAEEILHDAEKTKPRQTDI